MAAYADFIRNLTNIKMSAVSAIESTKFDSYTNTCLIVSSKVTKWVSRAQNQSIAEKKVSFSTLLLDLCAYGKTNGERLCTRWHEDNIFVFPDLTLNLIEQLHCGQLAKLITFILTRVITNSPKEVILVMLNYIIVDCDLDNAEEDFARELLSGFINVY